MAAVTINLNNKSFPIDCEDNQVELLKESTKKIEARFIELKKSSPMASTEYLLLLCSILLESENITKINNASENDIRSFEKSLEQISEKTFSIMSEIK